MTQKKPKKSEFQKNLDDITQRYKTEMVENGADAIVVIVSMTQNDNSKNILHRFGNTLLCDAMLRHTYHTETLDYYEEETTSGE